MDWQDIFKLLHVLTFVYWVGADLGVFYSARLVINPKYSPETRAAVLKLLARIDMIPRYMLLLTFPVGATLAANLGYSPIDGIWLYLVWAAAIGWIVLVWQIHHREGKESASAYSFFLPISKLFSGILISDLFDIQSSISFYTHKIECSISNTFFHS